ncbi:hypothetical protein CONLIGDRAFT_32201 [Coniochaeta ligniaria NRRL 30616]|uniref:Uncharacterized protein n=1 Tax=Coniochaeta ligniaria NRRL 30616 TaxID=1408157 RepID=A0A1J7JZT7_9PEZI|nr:hypothetical protein CONLIGDRAFT_32201 [Coniochaeta ligniaria NRRL 30616]
MRSTRRRSENARKRCADVRRHSLDAKLKGTRCRVEVGSDCWLQDSESKRRLPARSGVRAVRLEGSRIRRSRYWRCSRYRKCIGSDGRGRAARCAQELKGETSPTRERLMAMTTQGGQECKRGEAADRRYIPIARKAGFNGVAWWMKYHELDCCGCEWRFGIEVDESR